MAAKLSCIVTEDVIVYTKPTDASPSDGRLARGTKVTTDGVVAACQIKGTSGGQLNFVKVTPEKPTAGPEGYVLANYVKENGQGG